MRMHVNSRILLVEDDPTIVKTLTEFLKLEGFFVSNTAGQTDAIAFLEEHERETALVLLDVSLAEGNGFSACAEIKAKYDLPVIFLTASGDEYSVVTGLDLGADDYIGKPFRPRELVSRIRSVLRRIGRRYNRYCRWYCPQRGTGIVFVGVRIPPVTRFCQSQGQRIIQESAFGRDLGCGRRVCKRQYVDRLYQTSAGKDRNRCRQSNHYKNSTRTGISC